MPATAGKAPALTIDGLLADFGLTKVDYLKMDIEGSEAEVLEGPLRWAPLVQAMKVEIHPPATPDHVQERLRSNGFRCTRDRVHPCCVVATRA